MRDYETFEEQVEGLKRKQAGFAKERMLQEKKVKKLQGEKDKKVGLSGCFTLSVLKLPDNYDVRYIELYYYHC